MNLTNSVLAPPERITVSQAAEKYVELRNPGSYTGPYRNIKAPNMVEPMDELASRDKRGVVFVGPSQCGKTQSLILNWIAYSVCSDPSDMIIYQTSRSIARDFSRRRIDRMHADSPLIGKQIIPGGSNDNIFDKYYRTGTILTLSWPTINELSGRPVPRVAMTDYDRMADVVGGEGSVWDMARARTRSYRSHGKALAESSPSKDLHDPSWKPSSPHEAPPCGGILGLYNRGDRRRFYWPCPNCGMYFEGTFKHLFYLPSDDINEAAESVAMRCPHCTESDGSMILFGQRSSMLSEGRWLKDWQKINEKGEISGKPRTSDIASFWLKGVAACFGSWQDIVRQYLQGLKEYNDKGDQTKLKLTVNTDQAEPYTPLDQVNGVTEAEVQTRAEKPLPKKKVPLGVRFLLAQIDVQGGHWVVEVKGVIPAESGLRFDIIVIDRFEIRKSKRLDNEGHPLFTRPSAHPEDWDLITEQVIEKEYELEDGSGYMAIRHTVCDSGGKAGVTNNAYAYWRRLRSENLHGKFLLVKGEPKEGAPRVNVELPDVQRKDRFAKARGEIPVMFINANLVKDYALTFITRESSGGMLYVPDWFTDKDDLDAAEGARNYYKELVVEVRDHKGRWQNPRNHRNEAWDLLVYCLAQCIHFNAGEINWDAAPAWAKPWEKNALVRKKGAPIDPIDVKVKKPHDMAQLAKDLA